MSREEIREPMLYYTIVGGTFRTRVSQDDPAAVRRDWTSADGKKTGTKYERIVNAIFGFIKDVSFRDGEYGLQILIKLDENEDGDKPVVALSTSSREGEDFMKKLPNIDLTKEVRLRPFSFDGDGGDEVRGMEIMQQDEAGNFTKKITNFFRDPEKKENINGYPNPEEDTSDYSKDDWKMFYLSARKFLITYTKDNFGPSKWLTLGDVDLDKPTTKAPYPEDDIDPADIPFS